MRDATLTPSVLIDARELAAMLAISVPTVWRMRESGRLPEPLRLTSQCLRWRRADINAFLESLAASPKQEQP
jgi:prophage regulatory protein